MRRLRPAFDPRLYIIGFIGTNAIDSATFTWTGTGASYITETAGNEGNVSVYVDGVLKTTVSCNNAYGGNLASQQVVIASNFAAPSFPGSAHRRAQLQTPRL